MSASKPHLQSEKPHPKWGWVTEPTPTERSLLRDLEIVKAQRDELKEQLEAAHRLLIDLINWSPQTQRGREAMHPQHRAALEAAEVLVATPNPAKERE